MAHAYTTAELRQMAYEAETRLDWTAAADCWESAVRVYPAPGRMAELDKAAMTRRAAAARGMGA